MECYGITGKGTTLYTQYLTDRYQRVLLNNNKAHNYVRSKWSDIHHGVVQGPVLFLLCINELPKIINNTSVPV
jgi:hypothetical protein